MRKLLCILACFCFVPVLHAQAVEIYATVTDINANNVSSSQLLLCPGTNCPLNLSSTTNSNQVGIGGGITLNVLRLPILKLGIDARGSRHTGANGVDTALGGLKLTIHPPSLKIRPYLQGSFGYLGTTESNNNASTTAQYLAAEGLAGVDLPILPILDIRLIEVGVGHAVLSVDSTKPTFVTASAGLVLHF